MQLRSLIIRILIGLTVILAGEVQVQLPPEGGGKPREIRLTGNHAVR